MHPSRVAMIVSAIITVVAQFAAVVAQPQPFANPFGPPSQPQCECIPTSTPTACFNYDSRIQANSVEEAMAAFPDLTLAKPATLNTIQAEAMCTTQECIDCNRDLKKRLQEVGLLPQTIDQILLSQNMSTCNKYRFSRNDSGVHTDDDDDDDSDSDESEKKGSKERREAHKSAEKDGKDRPRRVRRQNEQTITAVTKETAVENIIGTRFTISTATKGVTPDSMGTVALCSSRWVWRKLPENYSPQFINELVCDTTDDVCLSGYATCSTGERAVEVVRNDSGVMNTVVLTAGSFCECRVATGSSLATLVTGKGFTGLPPQSVQVPN